ncbi:MAG: diacylglycerol kinase family lipid kinase [Chloroflexi bacterium]|nr:diacylglycerol kinase family lipid kinase [Chloroflexota bacterium]
MKTKLIVNPTAGRGQVGARLPQIQATLRAENFVYDLALTERRGHAIELTCAAIDAGYDLIVAVGGDGTLNEVVNGIATQDQKTRATVGVISSGTGSDFVRTAGLPRDLIEAARHLARATQTRALDLGEIIFANTRRYFVNVAGMGFDAEVIEETERGGKRGGGTIPYYTALIKTVARYQNKNVVARLDEQTVQAKMNSLVICNGKYFGGGMMIAPHASLDDGRFHVTLIGEMSAPELVLNTPRLYNGTILGHPRVSEHAARVITVEPQQRMLIEADGELIGEGAASFQIQPARLKLLG